MSGLVGYASSDDDESDIEPEKPAKIAKLEQVTVESPAEAASSTQPVSKPTAEDEHSPQASSSAQKPRADGAQPAPGPAVASPPTSSPDPRPPEHDGEPLSPFIHTQTRRRELTMPTIPNFSIPSSPPPAVDPEDRAQLAATTKKFTKFLELKNQGMHFNQRLQDSASLRNPGLLSKLLDFAGIEREESYTSSLPVEEDLAEWGGVPAQWPRGWYVEQLIKENERREKKRAKTKKGVDFVSAQSTSSSAKGTPTMPDGAEYTQPR